MDDGINRSKRRRHSAEFKAQVIQACKQPGVSIAATAMRYQLNANQVRIWIRAHDQLALERMQIAPVSQVPEFIPIQLPAPTKVSDTPDIVIEIKRGAANVTVRWPGVSVQQYHICQPRRGRSSSRRLFGKVGNFSNVSFNHENGSMPLALAVASNV